MKKKALVMFSGGLDSRIVAKMLEELGFEIILCNVKLPFAGCSNYDNIFDFSKKNNFTIYIIDATKGKLFEDYINLIKSPKYGVGVGINPCKDCKIFMFSECKKIAEKFQVDLIASGEVLAQRPMSQFKNAFEKIDEMSNLKGKVLRPLSAKLLPETIYEKEKIIDRNKLFAIHGRRRIEQIKLAERYNIDFPNPAGGCLLCEKTCSNRLKFFFNYKKDLSSYELSLLNKGRMFKKFGVLFVGRDEKENYFLELVGAKLNWHILNFDIPGPTIIYDDGRDSDFANELWNAYSSNDILFRKKFDIFKI